MIVGKIVTFLIIFVLQRARGQIEESAEGQLLKRVTDHLGSFMNAPVDAIGRAQTYLAAGGFSNDIDAADRGFLLKWLWRELPIYVYLGLEDGFFLYYNDFRTVAPPRRAILSREPGFSGYPTNPVPEESMKHWVACIDDSNGEAKNCTLPEGATYVTCIDGCSVAPCEIPQNPQEQDCSLLSSEEEKNTCEEESIIWCPQYRIETAKEGEILGTVSAYFSCINRFGTPDQTPGLVIEGGTYDEPQLGNCYHMDEKTLVNRTLVGDYVSCGGNDCNPFVGTYQTDEYDPRYRPWYMESKAQQRPMWTEPYPFYGDSSVGISYTEPIYTMEGSKKVFKGVLVVDYTLEEIRLFLSQYKGTKMLVLVVEAAEPNYVVAASTGSFASKVVQEDDMVTPCQDEVYLLGCATIRMTINDLKENSGDLILRRAFQARSASGFPSSELIPFKRSDELGDNAYISYGSTFEQPNANLKWHVIVAKPMMQSPSDAALAGTPSFYIICTVSIVGFVFCMALFAAFLRFRTQRVVQNADWRFTCAFILGCSMLNLSSLALLGENRDELCMLRMWLFNILFAAALSPLFVKVWRMHVLLHASKHFKRINVTNMRAMLLTLPIILAELVILVVFSFVDPSRAVEELGVADLELGQVQSITCEHETNAFYQTQASFHAFLVLIGCYLAFETRNLDPRFGEAKQLAFAMYNIAVTGIILVLIAGLVEMDRMVQLLLQAVSVAWGTMFNSAAFVVPKLMELQRQENKQRRKSSIHFDRKFVVQGNLQVLVESNSVRLSCWLDEPGKDSRNLGAELNLEIQDSSESNSEAKNVMENDMVGIKSDHEFSSSSGSKRFVS